MNDDLLTPAEMREWAEQTHEQQRFQLSERGASTLRYCADLLERLGSCPRVAAVDTGLRLMGYPHKSVSRYEADEGGEYVVLPLAAIRGEGADDE